MSAAAAMKTAQMGSMMRGGVVPGSQSRPVHLRPGSAARSLRSLRPVRAVIEGRWGHEEVGPSEQVRPVQRGASLSLPRCRVPEYRGALALAGSTA